MHPQAEQLANAMIRDFWGADHEIEWTAVEREVEMWLDDRTVLVGRIDGEGLTEGDPFFGEWKTIGVNGARDMEFVKQTWRMSPQSLTYGVLKPDTRRFTVRWAVKSTVPATHFEWYTFTQAEVDWWRTELLNIAAMIRHNRLFRVQPNWPTNFDGCYKYGKNYPCAFVHQCRALRFDDVPEGITERIPHLAVERKLLATEQKDLDGSLTLGDDREVVILDASRVETWLQCNEKYRRLYEHFREGEGLHEEGEALVIGTDFHTIYGNHLRSLIKKTA